MIFCAKCGAKFEEDQTVCPRCGEEVRKEADPRLQGIYQSLLTEKESIENGERQAEAVEEPKKRKEKKSKKAEVTEDPFERAASGFSAVRMIGPEYGKVKPQRKIARYVVMLLFTLASLAAMYLSFPMDKRVVIRGYEPALHFIRQFSPTFLAKVPCNFTFLGYMGYKGLKKLMLTVLPYAALVATACLVLALITLCFGLRYRRGVRFFGKLFLWLALIANAVQLIAYAVLFKSVFSPFPYGGIAAVGMCLLTIVTFSLSYRKPKKKAE